MPSTPYSLAILPIVLSAVVAPVTPAHAGPPLSGTYTIGASGTFPNLAAAVSAVTTDGAAGPVTFEIQSGVYAQQLGIFGEIPGASAVSRVRFTSQTGNADDVTLVRSANRGYLSDAVVLFSRARFVSVDHLTLLGSGTEEFVGGAIVGLTGIARDIQVHDCVLIDAEGTRYGVESGLDSILHTERVEIRHNRILGCKVGISLHGVDGPGNVIEGNTLITTGIGAHGIHVWNSGAPPEILIANNFVSLHVAVQGGGISVTGKHASVYHNSVDVRADAQPPFPGDIGTIAFLVAAYAGDSISVANNVFSSPTGYAMEWYEFDGVIKSDYNDFIARDNYIVRSGPMDWSSFVASTGEESHSRLLPAGFFSPTDLHTFAAALDGAGTPIATVTTDIDGEPRDPLHPDIGADEFVRPNTGVAGAAATWRLADPAPNPAMRGFQIELELPSRQPARVSVFDIAGRQVLEPLSGRWLDPGRHAFSVKTDALSPGLYFYRVTAGPFEGTRKVVVGR